MMYVIRIREKGRERMTVTFGILAGIIFLIYGSYVGRILKGNPQVLETEVNNMLSEWIQEDQKRFARQLLLLLGFGFILEAGYLILAFMVLHNPVMTLLTLVLAAEESLNIGMVIYAFYKYFRQKIDAEKIFNWKMERISAVFFFTHSFLALVSLFFYIG